MSSILPNNQPKITWSKCKLALIAGFIILTILITELGILYYQIWPGMYMLLQQQKLYHKISLPIILQEHTISSPVHNIPVKVFLPPQYNKILVVITGMHPAGYNDVRLIEFCEMLAGFEIAVVVPDIQDIKNFRFEYQSVKDIERTVLWTLEEAPLSHTTQKVGLMGFSYSGGLCLIAGSTETLANRLEVILVLGGHAHLDNLLEYLTTGITLDQEYIKPQTYGEAITAIEFADRITSPQYAQILRECMLHYLHGEYDQMKIKKDHLPHELQEFVQWCLDDNSLSMAKFLHPYIKNSPKAKFLSPICNNPNSCFIMLLHGKKDNLVPSTETLQLIQWCRPQPEDCMITSLIDHVQVEKHSISLFKEIIALSKFFSRFLRFHNS